jgi:hypothetical protein
MNTREQERVLFEAWCRNQADMDDTDLMPDRESGYVDDMTDAMWIGWMAKVETLPDRESERG